MVKGRRLIFVFRCRVWDMEALVCRRTLTGHKDDVLHITGLRLSDPAAEPRSAIGEREASPPPDPGLGALFATSRCCRRLRLLLQLGKCLHMMVQVGIAARVHAVCFVTFSQVLLCSTDVVCSASTFVPPCIPVNRVCSGLTVRTAASGCGARAAGRASASSPAQQRSPLRRRAPSCRQL